MQLELPKWMISRIREDFPNISIQHAIKLILKQIINSEEGNIILKRIIEEEEDNKGEE